MSLTACRATVDRKQQGAPHEAPRLATYLSPQQPHTGAEGGALLRPGVNAVRASVRVAFGCLSTCSNTKTCLVC